MSIKHIGKMNLFLKKNWLTILLVLLFLVVIILGLYSENRNQSKISDLELSNSGLKNRVDSLNQSKKYVDKVSSLQSEIMESTNKELIKNKKYYEDEIQKLDTMDVDDNYEANLRTIREYIEDRKRYNLK